MTIAFSAKLDVSAPGRRFAWIVLAAATSISIAMGIRQSFGLFVGPFSSDHGLPVTAFAFAIAVQNLVWGLAQPLAGAIADRSGAGKVVVAGGLFFAAGLAVTALGGTAWAAIAGTGILIGLALSCTTFAVVLGAIGRAAEPRRRAMALSLASAGGSIGQVGLVPLAQQLIERFGSDVTLLIIAIPAVLLLPIAAPLAMAPTAGGKSPSSAPSLRGAAQEAGRHGGYLLLTAGFFVCGFQLAFIVTHLPGYLSTCLLPGSLAATALALIGAFNVVGTWACGLLAPRYTFRNVLIALYLVRGIAIATFLAGPKTELTVLAFAIAMGLTWLGTVPMTSGVIAQIFGPRYLGMLFGFCFLSHQVGAFFGAWLGGYLFDATGSYDVIWLLTAAAGFVATALNIPIDDRPLRPVAFFPQPKESVT